MCKGSYKIKIERVKKSTSRYLGISNLRDPTLKIQFGKVCDVCLLKSDLLELFLKFNNFVNLRVW